MKASPTLAQPLFSRKSGVLVLSGYAIRITMQAGHLAIEDGAGPERRKFRLPRVSHGLKRIVVIGSDGFATFDAIRWPRNDERKVPDLWKRFGTRISPLTGSPRLAVTPPGAILNLLYGLLESESRLACVVMGLDPAVGMMHVDQSARDSLSLDILE